MKHLFFILLSTASFFSQASVIINEGSVVVVDKSNILYLNCDDLTIRKGGQLLISGTLREVKSLTIEDGGFLSSSGDILELSSWENNGDANVSKVIFSSSCGTPKISGVSDTDKDGTVDNLESCINLNIPTQDFLNKETNCSKLPANIIKVPSSNLVTLMLLALAFIFTVKKTKKEIK